MKQDIHPKVQNVIFEDASTGARIFTTSTLESQNVEKVDGVEYHVIQVEITSDSHPFFTGKKVLLDTAGQLDKFKQRMEKKQDDIKSKKEKKTAQRKKREEKEEA